MADNINVGGRLHSIATGNILAGANEILDDDKGKKQSDINTETYSLVNDVNERLSGLSPDQQSALSVAAKATNNETKLGYYVCGTEDNVAAKVISDATGYVLSTGGSIKVKMTNANTADNATLNINSTGAKALYYAGERASAINSWEAGETVEVYYDGTSYHANNVAGGSGSGDGAFDVSAKYPTSGVDGGNTYTLEGALAVLNTNLSARKKKGGMSIKFVQTSDNKYVQYRLTAQSFSTTESDWQKINDVDATLTQEGIAADAKVTGDKIDDITYIKTYETESNILLTVNLIHNKAIDTNGEEIDVNKYCHTEKIVCGAYSNIIATNLDIGNWGYSVAFYKDDIFIREGSILGQITDATSVAVPSDANYVIFSLYESHLQTTSKVSMDVLFHKETKDMINEMQEQIENNELFLHKFLYDDIFTDYPNINLTNESCVFYANGNLGEGVTGYILTDFIKVAHGTTINYSLYATNNVAILAFYDKNKKYIKDISIKASGAIDTAEINVPTEAVYVRFSSISSNAHVKMYVYDQTFDSNQHIKVLEEKTALLQNRFVYAAIGDSISSDEETHSNFLAYPRQLAIAMNAELDRHTIPGTKIWNYLKTFTEAVDSDAILVTVAMGRNDWALIDGGTPLGDIDELMQVPLTDITTLEASIMGKYRLYLETLKNRLSSNALIACISPVWDMYYDREGSTYETGNLLREQIRKFVLAEGGGNNGWYYIDGHKLLPYDELLYQDNNGTINSGHPNIQGQTMMFHNIYNNLPIMQLYVNRK